MTTAPSSDATALVLPAYQLPQRVTQARVIRAELTKLVSLPSAAWSLATALAVTTVIGVLYCLLRAARPPHGAAVASFDPTAVSLSGVELAILVTGILGVLFITGEYASGQVRSTFIAVPRRLPVLWGKAAVLAVATFAAGLVATVAAFGIGQSLLSAHHLGASLGDPGVARALVGSALSLAVAALLGLGLGALLRSTVGAIGTLFGLLFALPILAGLLPGNWSDEVSKYLPFSAGLDITTTVPDPTVLSPWTGLALFALYAAVAVGLGSVMLRRREA